MSILEVQLGVKKGEEEATNTFLDALRDYPVDGPIAHQAAKYIREWQKKSKTLDFVDAIIAATCKIHHLILVTYNLSHFPMSDIRLYQYNKGSTITLLISKDYTGHLIYTTILQDLVFCRSFFRLP